MLPLSHDEVVYEHSLIGKMPGDNWQRFANLRAYYGFMEPSGQKLLFMVAKSRRSEWNHDCGSTGRVLAIRCLGVQPYAT